MSLDNYTFIAKRYESDILIKRISYWVPPHEFKIQQARTPKTTLKIAAVVDERLYHGLRDEAQLMLLTPHNWKIILEHGQADFILMESIWATASGHWRMAQCPSAHERPTLLQILDLAKRKGIPTVFWNTKGHAYHHHYKEFAQHFDFVFCADPLEVEALQHEGVDAGLLLPCASNHKQTVYPSVSKDIPILYDGWADLDKMTAELNIFLQLKLFGLRIIESRYQIFENRKNSLPEYKGHILGCVSTLGRLAAMHHAKCYVTHDKTISSSVTQQWMSLEAVACGLPVIHFGALSKDDLRKNLVFEAKDEAIFVDILKKNSQRNELTDIDTQACTQKSIEQHSFTHRFSIICEFLRKK